MRHPLTPKQVARALDVSESSVKRWCDRRMIATEYTAGGHRRIAMASLLEFARSHRHQIVHPEALGLPATSGQTTRVVDRASQHLTEGLLAGDEWQVRQVAIDLYLAEHRLSTICDNVFAVAFRTIGHRWSCGQAEIYQERRSCELALRALHELRGLIPSPPVGAPVAIGCTPVADHYSLGTTMAELVLRNARWNSVSLGSNLPFASMSAAIRRHAPRLFWLSCSHLVDKEEFLTGYQTLQEEFGTKVAFVVGGQALTEPIRRRMKYAAHCDSMQHLEGFAGSLRNATEQGSESPASHDRP